ncbi:MAG: energy transducer TonB [Candidatus Poribacteria bacterium]
MGVGSLQKAVFLSLVVHISALLFVTILLPKYRPAFEVTNKITMVELEPIKKSSQTHVQALVRRQVVQTTKGIKVEKPATKAFLGERTQTVEQETVTRPRQINEVNNIKNASKFKNTGNKVVQKSKENGAITSLSNLGLKIFPAFNLSGEDAGQESGDNNWAEFGSLPQDYVKGIRESDRTALNTKEYIFFSYFQRIRQRLDRAWIPILRSKLLSLYRNGRQLASDMDHSTKILVTLDKNGDVVRVRVLNESGTRDLDEAAINAFRLAGPFPNPPSGIIDQNGEIQIPWEFILRT